MAQATNEKTTIIMASNDPVDSKNGQYYKILYSLAFKRIGYIMEYKYLPAKRASIEASSGRLDGELARIKEYGKAHSNLIRVEEHGISDSFCAYALNKDYNFLGWESLRGSGLDVEYLNGVVKVEQNLTPIIPVGQLNTIDKIELGLKRLIHKRTDIYIDSEMAVSNQLKTSQFKDSKIFNVGTLEKVRFYAFLNTKHKELAQKLTLELRKMRKEGIIETIYHKVFRSE